MCEIKFRAWDEQNKIMHYNFQFIKSGNEGNDWIVFTSDKTEIDPTKAVLNPYFRQQLKIMQFTGLKDKNGKEIYEGDIIKTQNFKTRPYSNKGKEKSFIGQVVWRIGSGNFGSNAIKKYYSAKWAVDLIEDIGDYRYCDWGFLFDCEVVGNIYETPNLLEEQK
jgi:uncharacterized phage protein (TIGR01671 family)